jgi:RNA polymerase sigma-70 factor (ECF subfamily)
MSQLVHKTLIDVWPRLFRYALRLAREPEGARDLLQQCAVKALGAPNQPIEGRATRAWLFRILRNAWIDQCRHEQVADIDPGIEPINGEAWHFDDRLISEITVRQGLSRLESSHREIIELIDIRGFKYLEAAAILGISPGTVMSRLSRARLALLKEIEGSNLRSFDRERRRSS